MKIIKYTDAFSFCTYATILFLDLISTYCSCVEYVSNYYGLRTNTTTTIGTITSCIAIQFFSRTIQFKCRETDFVFCMDKVTRLNYYRIKKF